MVSQQRLLHTAGSCTWRHGIHIMVLGFAAAAAVVTTVLGLSWIVLDWGMSVRHDAMGM